METVLVCLVFVELISLISCHPLLDDRIVGGTVVNIESFPHQLSLQYVNHHICGATILSQSFGITAAHCVEGKPVKDLSVYAGSNYHNRGGERRRLTSVVIHESYDPETVDNDVAIIKYSTPLVFNEKIFRAALPKPKQLIPHGTPGYVTGWGYTSESNERVSDALRAVQITVVRRTKCRQIYVNKGTVTLRMICAGILEGGRDSCQGDSGGPFTVNGTLVGIVSWGYGCARPGYPGVYTNVAQFRDFIKRFADV